MRFLLVVLIGVLAGGQVFGQVYNAPFNRRAAVSCATPTISYDFEESGEPSANWPVESTAGLTYDHVDTTVPGAAAGNEVLRLDGSSSVNLGVGQSEWPNGSKDMYYAGYHKWDTDGTIETVTFRFDGPSIAVSNYRLVSQTQGTVRIRCGSGAESADHTAAENTWHLIEAHWFLDGTTPTCSLWINGVSKTTVTPTIENGSFSLHNLNASTVEPAAFR